MKAYICTNYNIEGLKETHLIDISSINISSINTYSISIYSIDTYFYDLQVHMSGRDGKNELIFDDVQLEPNTMMTVYHCPVAECAKRNYLDAKSVRTHCRRFHSMLDYEPIPSQAEAQFICQVIIITIIGTIITKKYKLNF